VATRPADPGAGSRTGDASATPATDHASSSHLGARYLAGNAFHGLRPLVAGVVRSGLGFDLDVGALFADLARVIARANRSGDAPPT
jgi:hypothetical protein